DSDACRSSILTSYVPREGSPAPIVLCRWVVNATPRRIELGDAAARGGTVRLALVSRRRENSNPPAAFVRCGLFRPLNASEEAHHQQAITSNAPLLLVALSSQLLLNIMHSRRLCRGTSLFRTDKTRLKNRNDDPLETRPNFPMLDHPPRGPH
ncbi:hypothetical protein THAOC_18706, partial [Thalassiosira oceanica]